MCPLLSAAVPERTDTHTCERIYYSTAIPRTPFYFNTHCSGRGRVRDVVNGLVRRAGGPARGQARGRQADRREGMEGKRVDERPPDSISSPREIVENRFEALPATGDGPDKKVFSRGRGGS